MHSCNRWNGALIARHLLFVVAAFSLHVCAYAQVEGVARANWINELSGRVEGSVQQNSANSVTLNGGAVVTGDLLVVGSPVVRINGKPTYGGTLEGAGAVAPSNFQVMLNGGASLAHVVRRTDPVAIPNVAAPMAPRGNRSVTVTKTGQAVGDWASVRNLTLNGGVGAVAIPAGAYGDFTANGGTTFVLGVAGATEASVYDFQHLNLNGQARIELLGPVVINVANGFSANGPIGAADKPAWLSLNVYSGGFTLNGGCSVDGYINAPRGTVIVNGNSVLTGGVVCDRLAVNGGGLLRLRERNRAPVASDLTVTTDEDTPVEFMLLGIDPDGQALMFSLLSTPQDGALSGDAPTLTFAPGPDFHGTNSFSFVVSDGALTSEPATVTLIVRPVNDAPVAQSLEFTTLEDEPVATTLAGSDVDGDELTFSVVQPPSHGVLSGSGADLLYTPAADWNGTDSYTYVANDGTADSAEATVRCPPRSR